MKKNNIILFDIDDTLIDTHKLAKMFYQQMADQVEISLEKIVDNKEKYKLTLKKTSDYEPEEMMAFVYSSLKIDPSETTNPFIEKKYYKSTLFPEVKPTLKKLKEKYSLGIFSEGFDDFQSKKIYLSDIGTYFNENLIFIDRDKKRDESVKKLPDKAIIIDDNKNVIQKLERERRFTLFWINRKNKEKYNNPEVKTIRSLNELIPFLIKELKKK